MTVQCIRDGQFVVVVSRDVTLPRLSLDSVRLLGGNDPPCGPVESTPSFAIYQVPCDRMWHRHDGEQLLLVLFCFAYGLDANRLYSQEDSGDVVYENRMTSSYEVGIGPFGSITRDSHFE